MLFQGVDGKRGENGEEREVSGKLIYRYSRCLGSPGKLICTYVFGRPWSAHLYVCHVFGRPSERDVHIIYVSGRPRGANMSNGLIRL